MSTPPGAGASPPGDVDLYLFDTFEGMTKPTEKDVHWTGQAAEALLAREPNSQESILWAQASLDEVRDAMDGVCYPASKIHYAKGSVEDTIPDQAPDQIALLRLDTDWYESTLHEMIHLFPLLCVSGVLIIDDYGYWQGSRRAVDEYFESQKFTPLLHKLDYSGRIAVKTSLL